MSALGLFVWEDPPGPMPVKRGESRSVRVIAELQKHPGKWAKVGIYRDNGSATSTSAKYKDRGCESTCRGGDVYARWPEAAS